MGTRQVLAHTYLSQSSRLGPPEPTRHREPFACFDFDAPILPVRFGWRAQSLSLLCESLVSRDFAEIRLVRFPVAH
jgi:hypothetical protein